MHGKVQILVLLHGGVQMVYTRMLPQVQELQQIQRMSFKLWVLMTTKEKNSHWLVAQISLQDVVWILQQKVFTL